MGQGFSTSFTNALLNAIRGVTFTNTGANVQLHTGQPGPNGTAHISTASPARQPATFTEASAGTLTLDSGPTFTSSGGTETITHIAVFDDTGHFLWSAALDPARSWDHGDTLTIASLGLSIAPLAADQ